MQNWYNKNQARWEIKYNSQQFQDKNYPTNVKLKLNQSRIYILGLNTSLCSVKSVATILLLVKFKSFKHNARQVCSQIDNTF